MGSATLDSENKNKTVIIKVDPSAIIKKAMEESLKVNKVYVVPNIKSKEHSLKKISENDPDAEVLDISSLCEPVIKDSISKISTLKYSNTLNDLKKELTNDSDDEILEKEHESEDIHVTANQKEFLEDDVTEYEISAEMVAYEQHLDVEDSVEQHLDVEDSVESFSFLKNINSFNEDDTSEFPTEKVNISATPLSTSESKRRDAEHRIELAIDAVLKSTMSVKRAAHVYGVRLGALTARINRSNAPSATKGALGADPALTETEEAAMVRWIAQRYRRGCPVKKADLIQRVSELVADGRSTRFKDGMPGEKWFLNFLSRNPRVATLGPPTRSEFRDIPSKQTVASWFRRCEKHLQSFGQDRLLREGDRVGCVEGLKLCLKSSQTRVSETDENAADRGRVLYFPDEKCGDIMVLLGACGDGLLTPPMPVFSCRKPPPSLINSIPSGWGIGLSRDGQINKEVLHSYFKNILIPWLSEQGRLPFLLFIDKLKGFISMDTADYCSEKGLLIYNLYPNSTQLLQPLYRSVMEPVKKAWGPLSVHRNEKQALLAFCPALNQLLYDLAPPYAISEAFGACGLFPFDGRAPDYSQCLRARQEPADKRFDGADYALTLDVLENLIGKVKCEIFRETLKGFKLLKSGDSSLYRIWRQIATRADITRNFSNVSDDYRHERVVRGVNKGLPRPDTYLMVIGEGSEETTEQSSTVVDEDDPDDPDPVGTSAMDESEGSVIWRGQSSDTTKDKRKGPPKGGRRLAAQKRILEEDASPVGRKARRKSDGDMVCSQCHEMRVGLVLIGCMVCRRHTHFECMKAEEQQILSDLYNDNIEFDYVCPACSCE